MTASRLRASAARLLALLVPVLVLITLLTGPSTPARAANAADFRAGNIIADSVFFNADTMSAQDIQKFLETKVPRCSAGVCLRDIYQDTWTRPADAQCVQYTGAPAERASTIIYKVAQSCGVNPMVLLVLLQKEQGLITSTAPSPAKYAKATGYGCPDTPAGCDAQYNGFYNQVYKAAWAFKRYTLFPEKYPSKKLYANNQILWNTVETGCGSGNVYIENKATFALYLYTPYQPNQAAMNNLNGPGDRCSAYGNRNFWRYFTDWFGSTQVIFGVGGPVRGAYDREGGIAGPLGAPLGNEYMTSGGGLAQRFEHGRIHFSPASGAHAVIKPLSGTYDAWSGEAGPLGYPTAGRYPTKDNGWTQPFQRGRIHYSPATGSHPVIADIAALYDTLGGEAGVLGYPTTGRYAAPNGGFTQAFQSGRIHWSPATGAQAVRGVFSPVYDGLGGESGALGYPVTPQYATAGGGLTQGFQNGRIHWSPATGPRAVLGPLSRAYDTVGGESGVLGYPTTDRYATPGNGWTQAFQRGRVHYSPATGAHPVSGAVSAAYDARNGESGTLGYPTGGQYATTAGGVAQTFRNGTIVVSSGGTVRTVEGDVGARYATLGGAAGVLGEPTSARMAVGTGGAAQDFQHGRILDGPATGAHTLTGAVRTAYEAAGAQDGVLGWPTSDQSTSSTGSTVQAFQNGSLVVTLGTTRTVLGDIATRWTALGGASGPLGDPTGDRSALPTGGFQQAFTGGTVVSTSSTGTRAVLAQLATAYAASGGTGGPLGLPTGERYATPGNGWTQGFQHGRIHSSPATGTFAVLAPLASTYDSLRGESGVLGYPVGDRVATAGSGWAQAFQQGRLTYSPATGTGVLLGTIAGAYTAQGAEAGPLGRPTTQRYATPGSGWTQGFQHGRIHSSPATGAFAVIGPISTAYDALRGESGVLGYPVGSRYATAGDGWTQTFQHGRIHWSPATGARAVVAEVSKVYDANRGESGPLGYPVGDRYATAGNGWTQAFQHGRIHWSPATGGFAVLRPLSAAYDALRGESGILGYPTSSAYPTRDGGTTQAFRDGRIHSSPTTGAHAVVGTFSRAYDARGGESGVLGYPTGEEEVRGSTRSQTFQHGTITQTGTATPVVTVR